MECKTTQPEYCLSATADETAARQRTYLDKVFRGAIALFGYERTRARASEHEDGLDALDLLGGWEGSAARRRRRR